MPSLHDDWNDRYSSGDTPWDSGEPSAQLQRVIETHAVSHCRVLELGCGTGTNAVYLARHGFQVTAVDISPLAVDRAKSRAADAGVAVDFRAADILASPDLGRPYPLVFDRGVYHVLRREHLDSFRKVLEKNIAPGGRYLTLAGNANDTTPEDQGPPRVSAAELCEELETFLQLVELKEFHFDGVVVEGRPLHPLAWSALFRRGQPSTE